MIFNLLSGTIRGAPAGLLKSSPRGSYTPASGVDKVQVESINRPAQDLYKDPGFPFNTVSIAVYKDPGAPINRFAWRFKYSLFMQESESK